MIRSARVINFRGESMTMVLDHPASSGFIVKSITGLGPVKSDIFMSSYAAMDGGRFNSARVNTRNIVFNLIIDPRFDIETLRQKLYRFFPIKKKVSLRFTTDNRICDTEGYVESNEPDIFSNQESAQISILCPDPFFYSGGDEGVIYAELGDIGFEFPFWNFSSKSKKNVSSEI